AGGRGDTYGPYLGYLDEYRLYGHVLSPQQISRNYNDGLAGNGGPTRILTQEHSGGEVWTLNLFEIEDDGDFLSTPITVDTVTIVSGTSVTNVTVDTPVGVQSNIVSIDYTCTNDQSLPRDIIVEYSDDGGANFYQATLDSASTAGGVSENRILNADCDSATSSSSFNWNSALDSVGTFGSVDNNVQIRITADVSDLPQATTADFSVQNASAPEALAATYLGGH